MADWFKLLPGLESEPRAKRKGPTALATAGPAFIATPSRLRRGDQLGCGLQVTQTERTVAEPGRRNGRRAKSSTYATLRRAALTAV